MASAVRDRITGLILLAVAAGWIGLVYATIPPAEATPVGPRGFPLVLGLALGVLSLLLVLRSLQSSAEPETEGERPQPGEVFSVVASVAAIVLYGLLLEPLGFLPATVLIVAAMMVVIVRILHPLVVAAMALGLALGCYLVFGKLLGTYLPPGTLISITF